jgi:hypothetical protein
MPDLSSSRRPRTIWGAEFGGDVIEFSAIPFGLVTFGRHPFIPTKKGHITLSDP